MSKLETIHICTPVLKPITHILTGPNLIFGVVCSGIIGAKPRICQNCLELPF